MCQLNLHADRWFKFITRCNSIPPKWWLFGGGRCFCVCDQGEELEERLAPLPVAWKSSSGSLSWWNLHRCESCRQTPQWHKQPAQVMKTLEAQRLRNDGHYAKETEVRAGGRGVLCVCVCVCRCGGGWRGGGSRGFGWLPRLSGESIT